MKREGCALFPVSEITQVACDEAVDLPGGFFEDPDFRRWQVVLILAHIQIIDEFLQ